MGVARRYLRNLKAGLRLAVFLPVRTEQIHASAPMLVALFATALAIRFMRDYLIVGPNGAFMTFGVSGALFQIPVLLVAAVAAAAALRRSDATLLLATAFASLSLTVLVVDLALGGYFAHMLDQGNNARFRFFLHWPWIFALWTALAAAAACRYLLRPSAGRAAATAALTVLFIAVPMGGMHHDSTLWMKPYDDAEPEASASPASEEALYQQPKVLARALEAIAPGRPGLIDLYYLGFGGYASQDVFLHEVQSVDTLMRARFGAEVRSVNLLNNLKTVMYTPLASVTSLQTALRRIGEVMNRDEDILFLYMTSHGSSDHKFSLEFWPLQFNDLTPEVLRKALDDSGIRWRVVVISACYSGGFIDALKDDRTIVMTASAAQRRSFGCSNEAEWTYFGKAFFEDSLRDKPRLTEAFENARVLVKAREAAEKVDEHSEPQIAAGKAFEQQWDGYLAQLAKPPAAASPSQQSSDAIDDLVALRNLPALAANYKKGCEREMLPNSPEALAKRDPSQLGAMRPGTPQWQKLVAAWEKFSDSYCSIASDVTLLRRAYGEAWRENAGAQGAEKALRLLRTPEGESFMKAEDRATLVMNDKLVEWRLAPGQAAMAAYYKEATRLSIEAEKASKPPR
jgi:Peptidase C13 family